MLLLSATLSVNSQTVSDVYISGSPVVGTMLTGHYTLSGATADSMWLQWYSLTPRTLIGSGSNNYTVQAGDIGKNLRFRVTLFKDGLLASADSSGITSPVTANAAPVVSSVSIEGTSDVNDVILGYYSYSDAEGNSEGNSIYVWYISSSPTGSPSTAITGESGRTYRIRSSDSGKYLLFSVTPVALSGTSPGAMVTSAVFGPVNSAPVASSVQTTGPYSYPGTMNGSFSFSDPDGDLPATHILRWYRVGDPVPVGSGTSYALVPDDVGYQFYYEVTPVSATGYPDTGTPVASSNTPVITDGTGQTPSATGVCIEGTRSVGSVLTGKYTFTDPKFNEQNSQFFWYIGSPEILAGTNKTYTLAADDIDKPVRFAVIPRNNKGITGVMAYSGYLAIINLPAASFSVADPDVVLSATPAGGVFYGDGVVSGKFSPSLVGEGGPYNINYLLSVSGSGQTCTQLATEQVSVNPVDAFFESFRNVYCSNGGTDTIYVSNVPDGATAKTFDITNLNGIVAYLSDTSLIIDPSRMRPGNKVDTLFFSYSLSGSVYPINKPFVIDSVGLAPGFANLEAAYCEQSSRRFVTVQNIYPAGGTGTWTGAIVSDPTATSAFIDPSMGMPGNTYPVTYRYTSPLGCSSPVISRNVTVNPLPDAGFQLKATYNVDGPADTLKPVTQNGNFTGPGVSGYLFYPGLAGQGTHQITYTVTDANGCRADSTLNTEVKKASGTITGINAGNQYCYDGVPDTLRFESTVPWIAGFFTGNGINEVSPGVATFNPSAAGPGNHTVSFSYVDITFTFFVVSQVLNVDSVGQVSIDNLAAGSVFCNGDDPFTLYTNREGGVFTGPVTGNAFDPAKGPGNDPVVYTFTNSRTGCSSSVTIPVTIHASPQASFTVADVCIEHSADTTRFINNTTSADPVATWLWEFRDGGGFMTSDLQTAGYLYKTGGLHQIRLTATTTNNCSSFSDQTIDLGVKPEADFYWLNECFHAGDSVHLFDRTLTGSPVTTRSWNFFDGQPNITVLNPKYPKLSEGFLPVEYIVNTNYSGCSDTILKEIFIRPTVELTGDDYYEDFESGTGGWIKDAGVNNSWTFGTPSRPVINAAASGSNAWYTAYDIANQMVQSASVSSPCFDFTDTERPMISLKLWRRFDRNRDGAALQYKIGDNVDWEYLGTIGDGIEWFNSTLIKGRPGGDQIGWTTVSTPDPGWVEVRRRLDELNGMRDVKFRLAYGSDGTSQDNEGIAFDDVRIGTRTRNVLLEHFTNNSSTAVISANTAVNNLVSGFGRDVVNINYHTGFPGPDLLYNDIPADMSARVLYYGLTKVPYSLADGGFSSALFAGVYDYVAAVIDSNDINKRSLITPEFRIELTPVITGGLLVVDTRVTATTDLTEENLTLYIAVTAKQITTIISANGETVFRNTLRKMLPDAGGINLPKAWSRNEVYDAPDLAWNITNIYDSDDIEIIAFIQNNVTRKIYQASVSAIQDVSVGVDDIYGSSAGFTLYPNPSQGRIVIDFAEPLVSTAVIEVIDQSGSVLLQYNAEAGRSFIGIDDLGLKQGLYIVRMRAGNIVKGTRKLVVTGR